nr:LON peptidase substrate-binding domain-containing protein [Ramlibacter aurantiacus]
MQSLPLFPLGTVLFPGGVLPLRVFEVRYLDMITRCHKAGAPFGIVALTQGQEVRQAGAPPETLAHVGTLAEIEELARPQAGLMMVRVRGTQRFRVTSSQRLKHGLWVADVERLPDDLHVAVPPDLEPIAQALQKVLDSVRDKPQGPGQQPLEPDEWRLDDCGWVANRWCEVLPVPTGLKQRLMELDNPLLRLELVGDVLARMGICS